MRKILVVDDSPTDLLKIKQIVSSAGHQVITAQSGEEAIETAQRELPDMIFMDVIMKQVNGFKACKTITKEPATQHIPVILVSSKSQKADHMWAKTQGATALVGKPYEPEQILEQLARLG